MEKQFVEIEHTADIALHVWGHDLAKLFVNAAYGLACQLANFSEESQTLKRVVELEADDAEILLVTWLGELLYLGETDNCVFTRFDVLEIAPTRLRAIVWGESVHGPGSEPRGGSGREFHDLRGWRDIAQPARGRAGP